jgi:hypothetical protein
MTDKNLENRSGRDLFLEPTEYKSDSIERERLIDLCNVFLLSRLVSSQQQHAFIDAMAKVLTSI